MAIDFKKMTDDELHLAKMITDEAISQGLDPDFALSAALAENNGHLAHTKKDEVITSPSGAKGLMQIMPSTASLYKKQGVDIDVNDLQSNIAGGVHILKDALDRHGNKHDAIVEYNGGTDPSYFGENQYQNLPTETLKHLKKVNEYYPILDENSVPEEPTEAEKIMASGENIQAIPEVDKTTKEESALVSSTKKIGKFIKENPEIGLPLVGAGTAYIQRGLNKQNVRLNPYILDKEAHVTNGNVSELPLEEQYKLSQAPIESAGDKWSHKVVNAMGPGGEGVTEAARNYQMQQALSPSEAAKFKASRSGIIVPNSYTPVAEATNEALKSPNALQRVLSSTKGAMPNPRSLAMAVRNFPVANVLSGVGAGINAQLAEERAQEKDWLGAGVAGLNTLSGTAAMLPVNPATANPWGLGAKGAGVIGELAGIPLEYAYEKWRESHPMPSVITKEEIKKQHALANKK